MGCGTNSLQNISGFEAAWLDFFLIGQVQISLIKLYLLSNPSLDPASTEIDMKLSFGLSGFALALEMCDLGVLVTVTKAGRMHESGGISGSAALQRGMGVFIVLCVGLSSGFWDPHCNWIYIFAHSGSTFL